MSKYDIIIIGSGLGGLECGAILSKEGFNVCVVEKNAQFGGCFQTYQRKGHLLDTGIHYVGSLDEGQVMNQYFRYFGIMDKLKIKRLDDAAFDTIYYKGKTYDYAMGYPQFIETICRSFPHEKENLKCYAEQLQAVGNLISVDHLKQGTLALEGMKYFCTSAAHLIADMSPDKLAEAAYDEHGWEMAGYYWGGIASRARDMFRMYRYKDHFESRKLNEPIEVAHDVFRKEAVAVTGTWDDSKMYVPYPYEDVILNPNLDNSWKN